MSSNEQLDVIVRFHDVRRLHELDRAIFSLVSQDYRPLYIILVLQRFTQEEIAVTRKTLAPLEGFENARQIKVLNWNENEPPDGRSALINLGIKNANGRYIAFLDYDDVLYPEAYELLIGRLRTTQAAIAFGGICANRIEAFDAYCYVKNKTFPFIGNNVLDLFRRNFCPIHSFVIDTTKIAREDLFFDPMISRAEDYDFLIRLCVKYASDFELSTTYIGAYYLKNDGSNTILTETATTAERVAAWEDAESFLEGRRRVTPVSAAVQRALGLDPVQGLTVRRLLDRNSRFGP
jgi:glycosyltransferase involved in cell wall biosynthesis